MVSRVIESQEYDPNLIKYRKKNFVGKAVEDITLGIDGAVRYKGKLMVPQSNVELKQAVLAEANNFEFSIHSGSTKMY